jgi:predicted membrane protein
MVIPVQILNVETILITLVLISAFLFTYFRPTFVLFMHSILGKLFSIAAIVYYTNVDTLYGLFVCVLLIFFYQLDTTNWLINGYYNNMEGMCSCKLIDPNTNENINKPANTVIKLNDETTILENKKSEFQKKHCSVNGTLTYKNLPVKKDMSAIIYPEIKYKDEYNICNVCDKNCEYDIL